MKKGLQKLGWILPILLILWVIPVDGAEPEWPEVDDWLEEVEENSMLQQWNISSLSQLVQQIQEEDEVFSVKKFVQALLSIIWKEITGHSRLMFQVIALALLSRLLQNLSANFAGTNTGEIGFLAVYAAVLVLMIRSFQIPIRIVQETTGQVSYFSSMMIPALGALAAASGQFAGGTVQSGLILSGLSGLLFLFEKVFIPAVLCIGVLESVNFLSNKEMLTRLTDLGRTLLQKGVHLLCSLFLLLMGAAGMAIPAMNKVLEKTGSSLVSSVPIVGGALSGAMDTVFAGTMLVKNGIGAGACVILLCYCLVPVGKVAALWLTYRLLGALLAPVADPRISGLAEALGKGISLLLSILTAAVIIFTGAVGIFVYTTGS